MANAEQLGDLPARLVGGLFAWVGLGLVLAGVHQALSTRRFVQAASRAPGVVSRLNAGGSHPEIRFPAASGEVVDYPQGGMIGGYHSGDRVSVLYDPRRPSDGPCVDAPGALWLNTGMLFGLGAVFTGVGLSRFAGSRLFKVRGLED